MGGERASHRYQNYIYPACCLIVFLMMTGCRYRVLPELSFKTVQEQQGRTHLLNAGEQASRNHFQAAMAENNKAYALFQPGLKQEAIFQKALLYAHPDNPEKDYEKFLLYIDLIDKSNENMTLAGNAELIRTIIRQAREMEDHAAMLTEELKAVREMQAKLEKENNALLKKQDVLKTQIAALTKQISQIKEIDLNSLKENRKVSDE